MKIGIISAHKHCKTHITALRQDGYDVTCIGASPTSIPPSYEALVVRVASSSHGGTDVARNWGRETGRPLIYEDGLSGIRRELEGLLSSTGTDGPTITDADTAPISVPVKNASVRQDLDAEAHRLVTAGIKDPDVLAARLEDFASTNPEWREAHPAVLNAASNMIKAITAEMAAAITDTNNTDKDTSTMNIVDSIVPKGHRGPLPTNASWAKHKIEKGDRYAKMIAKMVKENPDLLYPIGMTFSAYEETCRRNVSSPRTFDAMLRDAVKAEGLYEVFYPKGKTVFAGKPFLFTMLAMYASRAYREHVRKEKSKYVPFKGAYTSAYKSMTGKSLETNVPDWIAWYLNVPHPDATKVKTPAKTKIPPRGPGLEQDVEENTRAILELMDTLSNLKGQVATMTGWVDTLNNVVDGIQTPVQPVANPLESLDEIKTRLSAMGFKGTLTLTIE